LPNILLLMTRLNHHSRANASNFFDKWPIRYSHSDLDWDKIFLLWKGFSWKSIPLLFGITIVAKRNYAIAKRTGSLSLLKSPSKSTQTFNRQNYQINFIINT
jgi:hypothetical protein